MDTVIRGIESKNGKRLVRITGENIEDEELERIDEHTKEYLEETLKESLRESNIIGLPITDSLKARIARTVRDQLQDLFGREYEFGVDVRSNEDNQAEVHVSWDMEFNQRMKIEEKKKEVKGLKEKRERRKNQTTMEEDFINFLIG